MKLNNLRILQKTTYVFFSFSLLMITFSIVDAFLCWYEVVEITLPYSIIWLVVVLITLLLLGISEKWKPFLLILFLGIGNFIFFMYVAFSFPISLTKSVKNTNYLLQANANHQYKIFNQNCCYRKVIAIKASEIFFTPNTKTGIVPFFEAKLLSETPEIMVLEIQTSGYRSSRKVKDTIRKRN